MMPRALRMAPALLLALVAPPVAAETLEDSLAEDWYEIEFFVFERPAVLDFADDELLTLNDPRRLPATMTAMRPGPEGYEGHYTVDAPTQECLTYPTLEPTLSGDPTPAVVTPPVAAEATPERGNEESPGAATAAGAPAEGPPPAAAPAEYDPRADLLARLADFEASLEETALTWLPPERLTLANQAQRIERSRLGRLLFHGRWHQAVPARAAPVPILIQAGASLEPLLPSHELTGTVAVTLGRYLHFEADLYFHAPALGAAPVAMIVDAAGASHERGAATVHAGGYMRLSESRRMRSSELHYLDHPKLGLVVRIDPVALPADLVEAFDGLEKPLQ